MIFVTVSTGHFDPLIKKCEELSDRYEFEGQIGMGTIVPRFLHFRTGSMEDIEASMRRADLVISHGGTGMLSQLYRLKKPAIVVPKQMRYGEANDMQVELARHWDRLGMALLCLDVNDLPRAIEKALQMDFQFPTYGKIGADLEKDLETLAPLPRAADELSPQQN